MGQSWIKLHTEMLHDPKVIALHPIGRYVWCGLLLMAKSGNPEGTWKALSKATVARDLCSVLQIGTLIGLLEEEDEDETWVRRSLERMTESGMIKIDKDGLVTICHWRDRQGDLSPSARPEQTRERKRAQRDRERHEFVTTCHDRGEEKRVEETRVEKQEHSAPENGAVLADGFRRFYAAYPVHKAPDRTERAFRTAIKHGATLEVVLGAITRQKLEREALARSGGFVPEWPYPATWLNGGRWKDETLNATAEARCDSCRTLALSGGTPPCGRCRAARA